jgi:hypothetical protein
MAQNPVDPPAVIRDSVHAESVEDAAGYALSETVEEYSNTLRTE